MGKNTSGDISETAASALETGENRTHAEELKQGIDNDEFELFSQPVISLSSGQIVLAEILVRWHKDKESFLPGEFLPSLEEEQVVGELDFYVLARGLQILSESPGRLKNEWPISFNLSPQLFQSPISVERIISLVEAFDIDKRRIWFEVKQALLLFDSPDLLDQLTELHQEGFKILADDVSCDPWALERLRAYPLHALKVAVGCPQGSNESAAAKDSLSSVIRFSSEQTVLVIGTGIERHQEAEILRQAGCTMAQGFYFGKPIPLVRFLSDGLVLA